MKKVDYKIGYLKSFKWKLIRKYFREKYGCCQKCGVNENLAIHHLTYINYPFEEEKDLVLVCKKCHSELHNIIPLKIVIKFFIEKGYLLDKNILDLIKNKPNNLKLAKKIINYMNKSKDKIITIEKLKEKEFLDETRE